MSRASIIAIAVALALAGCAPVATVTMTPAAKSAGPLKVAVIDFTWDPSSGPSGPGVIKRRDAGVFIADCVSARLGELPDVTVIPRDTVRRVDMQQRVAGRTLRDMVRDGRAGDVAHLLGADALVVGEVDRDDVWVDWTQQGETVAFSCRCVKAATNQTFWTLAGERVVGPNVTGPIDPTATVNQILDDGFRKLKEEWAKPATPS